MGGSVHFLPSKEGRKGKIDESNFGRGETKPTEYSFQKPAGLGLLAIEPTYLNLAKEMLSSNGATISTLVKLVFHSISHGKTLS